MSGVVVFLGPTLPVAEARARLDAEYLPPVSQGDVVSALDAGPRAIGIVDGYFQLVPAVWHKEILMALDRGIAVVGAASMGALRAAELADHGMVGVGRIFRWYRSGFLEADDEVAVTHAPAELGYRPLGTALVNIRATLGRAVAEGLLAEESAEALLGVSTARPYWERSLARLQADARALGLPAAEVEVAGRLEPVDQKRLDALEMLDLLADPDALAPPRFAGHPVTAKSARLVERDACLARDGERRLTAQAVADFYRLAGGRLGAGSASFAAARGGAPAGRVIAALREEGRLDAVVAEAARCDRSGGMRPAEGDDAGAMAAFCRAAGIGEAMAAGELAAHLGFDDTARCLERLHRFGPDAEGRA